MGLFQSLGSYYSQDHYDYDLSPIAWSPFTDTSPIPPIDDNLGDYDTSSLAGRRSNLIYGFMARDDSQVASDLLLLKSPLLSSTFTLEGGEDHVRAFVSNQLGLDDAAKPNPRVNFRKLLREMLTSLEHGFSIHELAYPLVDGQNSLSAEFRWQNSIETFNDDRGFVTSVVQQVEDDNGTPEQITLQRERLCYFSPYSIGDSHRGRSLLRSCYRPWFAKLQLFYADLLGTRRQLMPLPVGRYEEETSLAERNVFRRLLGGITSHRESYLLLPKDRLELDYLQSSRPEVDILGRFRYYNTEISRSLFSHILDLSESETANRSLSADLYEILFNVLGSLLDELTGAISVDVIQKLTAYNFGDAAMSPLLRWSNLDATRVLRIAEHIEGLGRGGFIVPDNDLEAQLRADMKLVKKGTPNVEPPTE